MRHSTAFFGLCVPLLIAACLAPTRASADDGRTLTLKDVIRVAHSRSSIVRAARHGVWSIEEREREAWYSRWLPTLQLRSLVTVLPPQGQGDPNETLVQIRDADGVQSSYPSTDTPAFVIVETGPDLSGTNIWSRTDLSLVWPLYTFGKLSAVTDMAAHGVDAANAILAEARAELAFKVKQAWYSVQLAQMLGEVITDGEDKIRRAKEKLEELEEEDSDEYDQDDTFRLRIHEARVRKAVLANNRLAAMGRLGLRLAMDLPKGTRLNLPQDNQLEPLDDKLCELAPLLELAARERPEMVAQRHRLEVAKAQVELRWAEYFPDIFLAANFTAAASSVVNKSPENVFEGAVFNSIGGGGALGLRLTLDYPQKVARYRRARADYARAEAEVHARLQLLRLKLEKAWREAKDNGEMLAMQKRAMRAAKSLLTSAANEYENGIDDTVTFDKVLKASVTYLTQKSEWYRAIYAFNISVARLSRVVGIDLSNQGVCR